MSFVSEHSAEFVVVPALTRVLVPHFSRVAAFYFWRSREGVSAARSGAGQQNRVVVVYARRPKVDRDGQIHVKFNCELFEDASYWDGAGIPVLAAVPCADSILSIHSETPCLWFRLRGGLPVVDRTCAVDVTTGRVGSLPIGVEGSLLNADLISIAKEAGNLTWPELAKW